MSEFNPLMGALGSLAAFFAVFTGASWLGDAWDAYARRNISDILPRLMALGLDEAEIQRHMRTWGILMFTSFFVLGVVLQMFPVAIFVVFVIFISPRFILDQMIRRRQTKLRDQLVRVSHGVANGCRAGMGLPQSIEKVLEDTKNPMRNELGRVVRDFKAGRPLKDAIREVQHRLDLEAFTIFASSITVAMERGGDITFALDRISHGLTEMQRLDRKLEADSASGRKLAFILSVFPFGFLVMFSLLDPENTSLLYTTFLGQMILFLIGAMVLASAKWCLAILDIDF